MVSNSLIPLSNFKTLIHMQITNRLVISGGSNTENQGKSGALHAGPHADTLPTFSIDDVLPIKRASMILVKFVFREGM